MVILFASALFSPKKPGQDFAPNPQDKRGLVPKTEFSSDEIRIDFSQGTNAYWVYINAATIEDYISKRKKAVEELKKMRVDLCDPSKVFWPLPAEIKNQLNSQNLTEISNVTCPK